MGGGRIPATGEVGSAIDPGTLARIGSPAPDVIGLDDKGGRGKPGSEAIADRVVSWTRRRHGERVGDGECFTLVDRALRNAGARTASHYGDVTPNADYVWGAPVNLADLRPGDVIQFRDYASRRETVREDPDATRTEIDEQERPHHTAVVERVGEHGAVTVLEQNIPEGTGAVRRTELYFRSGTFERGTERTTVTIQGTFWFYRPEAR